MVLIDKKHRIIVCILLIAICLSACSNNQNAIRLPPPENKCSIELDWHGLIPGQSTRDDVVKTLGTPFEEGNLKFEDRKISYYAYKVNGGEISKYALDRIFFRSDGLIDWMEIVYADREGDFESVFDAVVQFGNRIDTVYSNNNYRPLSTFGDVRAWPDQIYVWSECGLALDALPSTYSPSFQSDRLECKSNNDDSVTLDICKIVTRYSNPTYLGGERGPDANGVVLMKFYFQPTSYEAFAEFYMYKIPYGLWDDYLAKNK